MHAENAVLVLVEHSDQLLQVHVLFDEFVVLFLHEIDVLLGDNTCPFFVDLSPRPPIPNLIRSNRTQEDINELYSHDVAR